MKYTKQIEMLKSNEQIMKADKEKYLATIMELRNN